MSSSSEGGAAKAILVGVVLALVAGGSAPWWWKELFPEKEPDTGAPIPPPTTPKHFMGQLEGGTNRQGSDLSTTGIQMNSAAECSDLCDRDENCKAMTFVKHANANGGICWPKGSVATPTPNQAMVSAVKQYRR